MLNLLLEGESKAGGNLWIYVVMILLVVAMLVLPMFTNKKRMKEYNQMLDQLRVGDEIRTIGGIVGRVTKINDKGNIKTFILETGAKGEKTSMEFDIASVGTVLKSTYVPPVNTEENKKDKNAKDNKADSVNTDAKDGEVEASDTNEVQSGEDKVTELAEVKENIESDGEVVTTPEAKPTSTKPANKNTAKKSAPKRKK